LAAERQSRIIFPLDLEKAASGFFQVEREDDSGLHHATSYPLAPFLLKGNGMRSEPAQRSH
jgi:hypothetical protein